ncbi:unnamed protein product, partial [Allacma fusca]
MDLRRLSILVGVAVALIFTMVQGFPKKQQNLDDFYDFARECRIEGESCEGSRQCCSKHCLGMPT